MNRHLLKANISLISTGAPLRTFSTKGLWVSCLLIIGWDCGVDPYKARSRMHRGSGDIVWLKSGFQGCTPGYLDHLLGVQLQG